MEKGEEVPPKCEICLGVLQDPKLLPCYHISCRDCVKRLFVKGVKEVTCPINLCRKSFSCKDPESLPDALCVYHKRDVQRLRSRTTSGETICSLCIDVGRGQCQAEYFCDHCTYICAECSKKHASDPNCSDHKAVSFVDLSNQRDEVLSENLKRSRTMSGTRSSRNSCKIHPGNEKKIYCLDCGISVCSECIEVSHDKHNHKAIVSAARECCESIEETLLSVSSLAEEAEGAVKLVSQAISAVECQRDDLAVSIDGSFKQMIKILENKQKQLHLQLAGMTDTKLKKLKEEKHNCERIAGEMKRRKVFTKELLQTSTDHEIFIKFQFLEEVERPHDLDKFKSFKAPKLGLKKYNKSEFMDMCREIDVYSEQASIANCKLIGREEFTETMKHTTFNVMVCDKDNRPCSSVQDVRVRIKCCKNNSDCFAHVSNKRNGIHSVLFCPEFRGKHEVAVTINNTPMIGSPFTLNVRAAINRLGYPDIPSIENVRLGPRGITITPDEEIITCQWNGNKILKYNSLGTFLSEENIGYTRLTSVALAPSGHIFLVTAEQGASGVLKCNQNGLIEKALIHQPSDTICFKNPRGMAISHNGNIHVCDRDNNQVQIYSSDLNFICAFKLNFLKDEGIVHKDPRPNDIAFDCNDRMVITDIENCFIHVFDHGSYKFSFSRVQDEVMGSPESVAVGRDGLMYVSEYNRHRISVFQSDGRWLRSLGSKGTGDREVNLPTGVAVDAYGTVYVCDIMNNRIQIF